MIDEVEDSIKVIVVGDGNVGKTSMLRRFVKGDFTDQYKKTIGAEFMEKEVYCGGNTVKLMLWDTAGQEVFDALTSSYYRGAGTAVLAFSTIDRDSFMNIAKWKAKVEAQCGDITMVLCQTKGDLIDQAVVTEQEAQDLAANLRMTFFRISTKEDSNVTELFEFAAQQTIVQREVRHQQAIEQQKAKDASVEKDGAKKEKKEKKDKKKKKDKDDDAVEENGDDDANPPPPKKITGSMMAPANAPDGAKPKKKKKFMCVML